MSFRGPLRNAMKFAREEATAWDEVRQNRGWKLILMLPRMLLQEVQAVVWSRSGSWVWIRASAKCDDLAAVSRRRQKRRLGVNNDFKRRVVRAEMFVHHGVVFSQASIGRSGSGNGNQETLNMLRMQETCQTSRSSARRVVEFCA